MSSIPTPRSYNQILSDMLDAFFARYGISNVKPGSPILSIMEASAQSDLRSTQDIFSYLNSINLDRATGDAVDKIGLDEDLPRFGQTFGTGVVTISDTSFEKIVTKLYVGTPAPIVGSTTVFVADAGTFPATGSIYIGRGTINYEGPIAYTAKTAIGTYWSLTLATPTQKFHNLQEPVVLAQGGNRVVAAGSIVQTAQGNANEAVQFATLYTVNVPDGETSITGVAVVSKIPGTIGIITAAAIVSFASAPFVGASVTNPLPFSNAKGVENETDYKERIRNARQSRSKGTPLAITSGVLGVLAPDENKTVLSAAVITRQGFPATLYIDDGTGYEEQSDGVSGEGIVDNASGGERFFEVNNRPVAKAFIEATISEPYTLEAGSVLAIKVNGITFKHTFSEDEFRNIASGSAYEVVASINGDSTCPFNARLAGNGSKFAIIADTDTQENLEVTSVDDDEIDANTWLGLSIGRVDTMLLYKNDRLLSKDGRIATLTSNPKAQWAGSLTTPATVEIAIDNTPAVTYSFTSQDFIDENTGYASMATSNSLESWVTVFNARLPGVKAAVSGSAIVFVSNLGADARSRLTITGGSLISDGVLVVGDSVGEANDYTLDRNTGQLRLETVLAPGDVLSSGTVNTRAFIESDPIPTTTFSSDAESWWVVDGEATVVATGVAAGTIITIANDPPSGGAGWGYRARISATGTLFTEVQADDWAIFNDSAFDASNRGAFRIAFVDPGGVYFEIERSGALVTLVPEVVTMATSGLIIVNTLEEVQRVVIDGTPAVDHTAASLADEINAQLRGATAYVSRTTKLRVRTNTFGLGGNIALVAQDSESEKMLLDAGDYVPNLTSHLASVEAVSSEVGTPEFTNQAIDTVASTTQINLGDPIGTAGHFLVGNRALPDVDNTTSLNYTGKTLGWAVAETVTGVTSGATGVIGSVLGGAPGLATGTIVLTSVTGVFLAGELLTGSVSGASIAAAVADTSALKERWAGNHQHSSIFSITLPVTYVLRTAFEWTDLQRLWAASPYAIGPTDDFTVVVDDDQQIQRFAMPMYRKGKPASTTYGTTNFIKDNDNSLASLAAGFGVDFDWLDYAVWMKARAKTHNEAGDTTKTILYRYSRFGPEGNQVYLRYDYPTAASAVVGVTTDNLSDGQTQVSVTLPSGPARTGITISNGARIGTIVAAGPSTLQTLTYIIGFSITTATTTKRLKVKGPTATAAMSPGDAITGVTSGATATVIDAKYDGDSTPATRGYLTLTAGNGLAFIDGETITSPTAGVHTGTVDGTQYGLVTATLDVATPGATDHGFTSHILTVASATNFGIGDLVHGATSNAMALVREKSGSNLIVSELSGTFIPTENLSSNSFGAGASTLVSVTNPTNVLYMQSIGPPYNSGLKNIIGRGTGTTIQYIEGVIAVAPTATPGTVSWDTAQATTTGSTAVNGDLVNISSDASLGTGFERTIKTSTLAAQYWKGPANGTYTNTTVPTWGALNQSTNLSFFPISTATATAAQVATAVNAVANAPVTAVAIGLAGVTTGVISQASYDEFPATANKHYTLADGLNWIQSQVNPPDTATDFSFTFKDPITASLATNSDWLNEDLRLVPTTTKNVVDWLNAQAVSGLSSVAESARAASGDKPQIASLLSGRIGSVQVQGGTANAVSAPVVGSAASILSTYLFVTVKASDAVGLHGDQWVALQNFITMPKQVFTATSVIASVSVAGLVTMDASSSTNAWNYANVAAAPVNGFTWQIEKQGRYVVYTWNGVGSAPVFTGVSEGDWVIVSGDDVDVNGVIGPASISSRNRGTFRIVRIDNTTKSFWIENSNELDQSKRANLLFLTYDSILPGDVLTINTTLLGASNQGTWTVASINTANRKQFTLDITDRTPTVFAGPLTLGTSYPLFQLAEGLPTKLIKKIRTIAPNANATYVDIKFETVAGYRQVGSTAGTVIQSLDKLAFPTSLVQGVDGYRYSTGLIREVNRVAYGDPGDSASYPGIVAAGAQVNIEGPLVKRITCSLALRLKSGVAENDIKVRVRSAVASVINNTAVGASISISDLIDAAGSVAGVVAVTWLTPTYGAGNDLISVQPFEKPLVLDLVQDIRISLVSE